VGADFIFYKKTETEWGSQKAHMIHRLSYLI